MAGDWLLLLLALGCPALPAGVGGTPFPSLAPPITRQVDGKQQVLVVCLVLDAAPPGLESPVWFSAGNGSALGAFTYGPSPAADGTWTRMAQLSLPAEELASWEALVCHTGPGAGDRSQSTQPLQLSGETPSARTCPWEPLGGPGGRVLRLGALRLLLFKLLLVDLLLTCSRLLTPPAAPGSPHWPPRTLGSRSDPPSRMLSSPEEAQGSGLLPLGPGSLGVHTCPLDPTLAGALSKSKGALCPPSAPCSGPPPRRALPPAHPGPEFPGAPVVSLLPLRPVWGERLVSPL